MKKGRGTAIVTALVVLLAGYTYWEYRNAEKHSGDSATERRLFYFVPEDVKDFKLTHGKDEMVIVRDGDQWKMKKPFDDLGDKSAVDAFLYSLMIQRGRTVDADDQTKTVDWGQFGLNPPGYEIAIHGKVQESLQVSSKNAYDGSYYLNWNGKLMLGDRGLAQVVGRDPSSLRSKRLFREQDVVIKEAQVTVSTDSFKGSYKIVKKGNDWTVEPKPEFLLDENKLETWLAQVHALTGIDVAAEALTDEQKRNLLLLKPSFTVDMKLERKDGKESEFSLTAGQDRGEDVFVYTGQRPTIYKFTKGQLANLRVPEEFFRDGKQPFKFPIDQAHDIRIGGHHIVKDGSTWKLQDAKPDEELSSVRLQEILEDLAKFEALTYPSAKMAKGFKDEQKIVFRDSQGKVLFDLSWGDEFKAQETWNKGMTFRFVRSNLEKETMGVNQALLKTLLMPGLIIQRAEKKK